MEPKNENRIALIYVRVSSDRQATEGHGLDSQEFRCRAYARSKGYSTPEVLVFKDQMTGGGDFMKRPGMVALLAYIDKNTHQSFIVIFDDLSRFARDVSMHIKLRQKFNQRDARIECPNFTFEDTPEGELVETIMAAQSQYHRKSNGRQVIQKQKAMLEAGGWPFGGMKIGYERVVDPVKGKKIMTPNSKADIVAEGLNGFAYKRFAGQIDLARFWQERGIFSKHTTPEHCLTTVKKMIKDPFYTGFVSRGVWELTKRTGWQTPLITEEVFELNQKRLKGEIKGVCVRYKHNPDFVVCGFVNCAECNSTLRAYWSKGRSGKYAYYECKKITCSLKGKTIKQNNIESEFDDLLVGYKPKRGLIALATKMFEDACKVEFEEVKVKRTLAISKKRELGNEISSLTDKLAKAIDGSGVEAQLSKRLEEKAEKIKLLEENISNQPNWEIPYRTAAETVFGLLESPLKLWTSADINQKQ